MFHSSKGERGPVPRVSPEDLVAAIAIEGDRDVLAGELRHVPGRHGGRIPEWFSEVPRNLGEDCYRIGLHDVFMVLRPIDAGNGSCVLQLVEPV